MFISILVIVFIWNNSIHATINDLSLSRITSDVKDANNKFENALHDLLNDLKLTSTNPDISEYFLNPTEETATDIDSYLRTTYQSLSNKITGIALVTDEKMFTAGISFFSKNIRKTDWYKFIVNSNGNAVIVNRSPDDKQSNLDDYSIGILIKQDGKDKGVLIFNLMKHFIVKDFNTNNMNGILKTVIVDNNQDVIYSTISPIDKEIISILYTAAKKLKTPNSFATIELCGEPYLITSKTFASRPRWINITFFPKKALYKNYTHTINLTIWCMILVTLIAILIAYTISNKISRKFQRLSTFIDSIDFNNLNSPTEINNKSIDEIDNISNRIVQMMDTISNQFNTISDLEEKKHSYEIQILKAQINPHLIYNTLNSIQSLAEIQNSKSISTITKSLSELLQYSVVNTDSLVTLADEIQYIKNYTSVMQCKFLNQINLVINIEEDLYNCLTLKMILQPIVENALKHGFTDRPEEYIVIKAYRSEVGVSIKIIDNGSGIEPDVLKKLLNTTDEINSHIGLNNVNRRIKLTFGDDYGLSIYSTLGIQTTVIIDIPYLPS